MYDIPMHKPEVFASVVEYSVNGLREIQFDALVFRGFSGAVVGAAVAHVMQKPWILVRKPSDSSHSGCTVEGTTKGKFVIIDDFLSSGQTVRETIQVMGNRFMCPDAQCIGVFLYDRKWVERNMEWGNTNWDIGVPILNWAPPAQSKTSERQSIFDDCYDILWAPTDLGKRDQNAGRAERPVVPFKLPSVVSVQRGSVSCSTADVG